MRTDSSNARRTGGLLALAGMLVFAVGSGAAQALESASDLIKFLTYQADRPGRPEVTLGLLGCGHFQEDRAVAKDLVGLGASASAQLERALDSLQESGEASNFSLNAGWLLEAYARINGPQAYPRLRRMMENAKLDFLQAAIDTSTAISLGMTSYVHASRRLANVYHCGRSEEPRDALDRLVLGWLRADGPSTEASVGPNAEVALKQLLMTGNRSAVRSGPSGGRRNVGVAVGYRFRDAGKWGEPGGLIGREPTAQDEVLLNDLRPEIRTEFTSASGKDCGAYMVRFTTSGTERDGAQKYLVDNSDIAGLLRLITHCATMEK